MTGLSLRVVRTKTAVKTLAREKRYEGPCQRRALGVYTWDTARGHDHHPGPCPRQVGETQVVARSNSRESLSSPFQWRMDDTWMMVETS